MNKQLKFITTAAVTAALYAALTYAFSWASYQQVQFRVSEALTILPFFTPAAVPGLFLGCILSNIASPLGPVDIAVGSAATLLAAFLTRLMPKKVLAPLPPVICNAVFVGLELHFLTKVPLLPAMLYIALGEAAVCYLLGYPLLLALNKIRARIF